MILREVLPAQAIQNDFDISLVWLRLQLSQKSLDYSEEVKSNLILKVWSATLQIVKIMRHFIFVGTQGT